MPRRIARFTSSPGRRGGGSTHGRLARDEEEAVRVARIQKTLTAYDRMELAKPPQQEITLPKLRFLENPE